jgi:hypothetical protein
LATAFATAAALIAHDYRDADGWTECWRNCSALQTSVGLAYFWGGMLLVALGLGALTAVVVRRRG